MILLLALTFGSALAAVRAERVCYGELGCFTDSRPFDDRPLPDSPADIGLELRLFTRANRHTYDLITSTTISTRFSVNRDTQFLVHGYLSDSLSWATEMKNALLDKGDYNVIVVDWEDGANPGILGIDYPDSASNTRVVGASIGLLAKKYREAINLDLNRVHCIGHSLGAQTCGYAGSWLITNGVPKMGWISGMDPAGPFFKDRDGRVRLTADDANFVDVIHTNGLDELVMYGIGDISGHVDIYPAGGGAQPGCGITKSDGTEGDLSRSERQIDEIVACSHARAHVYYIESIRSACQFRSYPCNSNDEYDAGGCRTCGAGCQFMGWKSRSSSARGTFYVSVNEDSPHCMG